MPRSAFIDEMEPVQFSVTAGGLLYRFTQKLGLTRPGEFETVRTALFAVIVAWLPLGIIEVINLVVHGARVPLLFDPSVHARLLIVLPLLFAAELVLHQRCDRAIKAFLRGSFAAEPASAAAVQRALRTTERLRDSNGVEAVLLGLGVLGGQAALWGWVSPAGFASISVHRGTLASPALVWYAFIALPIFQFVLLRWMWRWAIWSLLLFRMSRVPLRLVAMHPDRAGGLGVLAEPTIAFGVFLVGIDAGIATIWLNRILDEHMRVQQFIPSAIGLIGVALFLAFGPLTWFTGHMLHARLEGIRKYDELALGYTRAFDRKWTGHAISEDALGNNDFSGLADLIQSYQSMRLMRVVPFEPRWIALLVIAALLPLSPLLLTEIPLHDLISRLGSALVGLAVPK